MTAVDQSLPRTGRGRSLRDDLLDDLRRAAPMPAAPVPADVSLPEGSLPDMPLPDVPVPDLPLPEVPGAEPARPGATTLVLRLTPRQWSRVRLQSLGSGGFLLGAGPLQICLTGLRS